MKRIIIFLILLFIICSNVYSETRGVIRNKVRYFTGDLYSNSPQPKWSNTNLNDKINTAQTQTVNKTYCIIITTYITTTANTREYTLPSDFLRVRRASYYRLSGGTTYYVRLENVDKQSLDRIEKWEIGIATIPVRYYVESNTIGLDPKPYSSLVGTSYLKVEYYARATDMTADTDIPFNGLSFLYPYHDLITYYVCYLCENERNKEVAKDWENKYSLELKIMFDMLSGKPEQNPVFPSFK